MVQSPEEPGGGLAAIADRRQVRLAALSSLVGTDRSKIDLAAEEPVATAAEVS